MAKKNEKAAEAATMAQEAAPAAEGTNTQATAEKPADEAVAATLDDLEALDMETFANEDEGEKPAWRITDDGCADWACRKIAEERAELRRIQELADEQIARIEEKVAAAERRCDNGTRFLTGKLAEYFGTVPHKSTKTQETYRLLSGTLKFKKPQQKMEPDNDKLLDFLRASGNTDMIQQVEKPKWGDFKKRLEAMGGTVVDKETGEIVDGVKLIETPGTFTVDV